MRRKTRYIAAATIGAIAAAVAVAVPQARPGDDVIIASGSDHLPSQDASDWVTYADHVVVATPVAEREVPPGDEEIARGEGMILREVTLKVDRVLWSNAEAGRPAPASFDWNAFGWQFRDGSQSNRIRMAAEESPRIEAGHSYIMAIVWEDARCSPGDFVPARWTGLGSSSTVPFDDNVIGNRESEGQNQTVDQAREQRRSPTDPNYSLEDKMVGLTADALADELKGTKPGTKQQFGPPPSSTSCN